MLNVTMHTTNQILDALSASHGGVSDYRLAKLLGTSTQAVANWRKGRTALSLDYAHKAAALLKWEPAYVVACVEHERASKDARLENTDEIKATWDRIAQAFKPAAAVILAVLLGLATPRESVACERGANAVHAVGLYIMRTTKRFVAAAVRRVARLWKLAVTADCGATVIGECA